MTSDSDGDLSLRKVKRVKNRRRGDRYIAINNTNTNTVEFRMFSSTKSYETLMATLEMVNNIVNIAKYKNIDGLTWANLVNYQSSKNEFLNNYVKSLNINSDTSISLVDEFERNVNNYSLRKFLDGDFVINCNCGEVEDINKPSFLLPLLLSNKVTYFSNAYDSMLNCLQRKIFNEEVICVRMCGEDNRLVSYRESYNIEHSANLDEIIELWIENPELMRQKVNDYKRGTKGGDTMCIIVSKERGIEMPSKEILKNCFNYNSDGAGLMYVTNGKVNIVKGFMTFNSFYSYIEKLEKAYDMKEKAIVMHFRISTQGNVDEGNCHPYPITRDEKKLRTTNIRTTIVSYL